MKKIAGIGLFIGGWGWIIFFVFSLYEHNEYYTYDEEFYAGFVPVGMFFSILSVSAIYYVWITLFRKPSGIKSIEIETKIIKLQIEKKELLATLEALEKNG